MHHVCTPHLSPPPATRRDRFLPASPLAGVAPPSGTSRPSPLRDRPLVPVAPAPLPQARRSQPPPVPKGPLPAASPMSRRLLAGARCERSAPTRPPPRSAHAVARTGDCCGPALRSRARGRGAAGWPPGSTSAGDRVPHPAHPSPSSALISPGRRRVPSCAALAWLALARARHPDFLAPRGAPPSTFEPGRATPPPPPVTPRGFGLQRCARDLPHLTGARGPPRSCLQAGSMRTTDFHCSPPIDCCPRASCP